MSQPPAENGDSEDRESVWERARRELASNPDSPASLKVMAAVNSYLRPQQSANEQLFEEVAMRQDDPGELTAQARVAESRLGNLRRHQ